MRGLDRRDSAWFTPVREGTSQFVFFLDFGAGLSIKQTRNSHANSKRKQEFSFFLLLHVTVFHWTYYFNILDSLQIHWRICSWARLQESINFNVVHGFIMWCCDAAAHCSRWVHEEIPESISLGLGAAFGPMAAEAQACERGPTDVGIPSGPGR